jgi:hypothetical protein
MVSIVMMSLRIVVRRRVQFTGATASQWRSPRAHHEKDDSLFNGTTGDIRLEKPGA